MASKAVLAIDVGSTETRVVITWRDEHGKIRRRVIQNLFDATSHLNLLNQFSSRVLVHDEQIRRYIGNGNQSDRQESSAKFVPYMLVGEKITPQMEEQYKLLQRLRDEEHKVGRRVFVPRLLDAYNQFLRFVLEATKSSLELLKKEVEQMHIGTVALTIPSQWNLDFEDLYRRLFLQAFRETFADKPELAAHDIVVEFYSEADALAHYIFHQSLHKYRFGGGMPDIEEILSKTNAQCLIDCGGHNANSTLTSFHRNNDGSGALCQLRKPEGAGGGSEMLLHNLWDQLIAQYREESNDQSEIPHWFYQELKRLTTGILGDIMIGPSQVLWIVCPHIQTREPIPLKITMDMRKEAFETGFRYVKNMVKNQLHELAKIKMGWVARDHIVTIIVSGGSARHPEFFKWIKALCASLSLPEPLFASNMDLHYGPCRIATGAAYASLTTTSVDTFAEKCAFGLQKCNVTEDEHDGQHIEKEDDARTIWTKERGVIPAEVVATGNMAEYRIVCQPFLESFADKLQTDRNMAEGESYDFLNIGTLPDCSKCRFEFKLSVENKQADLKLFCTPFSTSWTRTAATAKETVIHVGPFPVYVEAGTRNLLIHQSREETDKQIEQALEPHRDDTAYDADDFFDGDEFPDGGDDQPTGSRAPANIAAQTSVSVATASIAAGSSHETPTPGSSSTTNRTSAGTQASSSGGGGFHSHNNTGGGGDDAAVLPSDLGNMRLSSHPSSRSHDGMGGQELDQTDGQTEVRTKSTKSTMRKAARVREHYQEKEKARAHAADPSSASRVIASKADTRLATERAFRPSKVVSEKATPNSRAGPGATAGERGTASGARLGQANKKARNNDTSSTGRPSSSNLASSSKAVEPQGSAPTSKKRPADPKADDLRPQKRAHTSRGASGGSNVSPRQNASPRKSSGYQGTAFSGRPRSTASETRPAHSASRDHRAARPSADRPSYDDLTPPSRRSAGQQSYEHSDRYRAAAPGFAPAYTASRGPGNTIPLTSIFPAPLRHPRDGSAAPAHAATAAGNATFGPLRIGSPRPGSGSEPPRTSGPARDSQQQPRGFRGFLPAHRDKGPPRSD